MPVYHSIEVPLYMQTYTKHTTLIHVNICVHTPHPSHRDAFMKYTTHGEVTVDRSSLRRYSLCMIHVMGCVCSLLCSDMQAVTIDHCSEWLCWCMWLMYGLTVADMDAVTFGVHWLFYNV